MIRMPMFLDDSKRRKLNSILSETHIEGGPGHAIGVFSQGELKFSAYGGLANMEHQVPICSSTVFHIASISKQFTAFSFALLAQQGLVEWDRAIATWLPELKILPKITPRQIVHHTSGLRDQWDLLRIAGWRHQDLKSGADILKLMSDQTANNFEPGSRYQYINSGYTLLGFIIERVSGQSLRDFARAHIFQPLGMLRTEFAEDASTIVAGRASAYQLAKKTEVYHIDTPAYATCGPTGLLSTVEDFLQWERNFLQPLVGSKELIEQTRQPGYLNDQTPLAYGLGFWLGALGGYQTMEHAGGDAGFRSHYLRIPEKELAVVVFANHCDMPASQLAHQIAKVCLGGDKSAVLEKEISKQESSGSTGRALKPGSRADALEQFIGRYHDANSDVWATVTLDGDQLTLRPDSGGAFELQRESLTRFRFVVCEAHCEFDTSNGLAQRLTIYHGGNATAQCARISHSAPKQLNIDEYCGEYESAEVGASYRITGNQGQLCIVGRRSVSSNLEQLNDTQFVAPTFGWQIKFIRKENSRVELFELSAERAWKIAFFRR